MFPCQTPAVSLYSSPTPSKTTVWLLLSNSSPISKVSGICRTSEIIPGDHTAVMLAFVTASATENSGCAKEPRDLFLNQYVLASIRPRPKVSLFPLPSTKLISIAGLVNFTSLPSEKLYNFVLYGRLNTRSRALQETISSFVPGIFFAVPC